MRDELSGTDPILPWKLTKIVGFPFFCFLLEITKLPNFWCRPEFRPTSDMVRGTPPTTSTTLGGPAARPEITQRYPARHQLIDEDSII